MLRLIITTLALALLALGAAWLSAHPGHMSLTWLGWRIEASASFFLFAVAVLAGLGAAFIVASHLLLRFPERWQSRRRERYHALGLRALTQSLVALADGDTSRGKSALRQARKFLNEAPAILLLEAQIERLRGDEEKTCALLEAMLNHRETRSIAAKGLSEYHARQGQAARALPHASAAVAMKPQDRQALRTLLAMHLRLCQWQDAENALRRAGWFIPRMERRRLRGLIYAAHALELKKAKDMAGARTIALQAMKLMPDFPPMLALVAELTPEQEHTHVAMHLLKHGWKRAPHAALADALLLALAALPPADQLKAIRKIAGMHPEHDESQLLLARSAMQTKAWDEARTALKHVLDRSENARACRMMATLEEAQYRDADAAARWRLRAEGAEADAAWICSSCGHAGGTWAPLCPECHALDTLEWKRRPLRYATAA